MSADPFITLLAQFLINEPQPGISCSARKVRCSFHIHNEYIPWAQFLPSRIWLHSRSCLVAL